MLIYISEERDGEEEEGLPFESILQFFAWVDWGHKDMDLHNTLKRVATDLHFNYNIEYINIHKIMKQTNDSLSYFDCIGKPVYFGWFFTLSASAK